MLETAQRVAVLAALVLTTSKLTGQGPVGAMGHRPDVPASLADLVAKLKPSIVTIDAFGADKRPLRQGTGFFVGPSELVTNLHVVEGAHSASIRLLSNTVLPVAGLLAHDERHDLALLSLGSVPGTKLRTAPALEFATVLPRAGDRIVVIGSPYGLEHTVSDGIVSAIRLLPRMGEVLQVSAAISPGSSGSPVMSLSGQVVGVATSQLIDGQQLNFCRPIRDVVALKTGPVQDLATWSAARTPRLSRDARAELFKGMCAGMNGDWRQAIKHGAQVTELAPDSPDGWMLIGFGAFELGDPAPARYAFERAIERDPQDAEPQVMAARTCNSLGMQDDARDYLLEAIRIDPEMADAHQGLGLHYRHAGDFDRALRHLEESVRLESDNALAHFNLGATYGLMSRHQDALREYRAAIAVDDRFALAYSGVAGVLELRGRHDEAIEYAKSAVKRDASDPTFHWRLGTIYFRTLRWEEAYEAFKESVKADPDFPQAHLSLGALYVALDMRSRALEEYKILKRLDAQLAQTLFDMIYESR